MCAAALDCSRLLLIAAKGIAHALLAQARPTMLCIRLVYIVELIGASLSEPHTSWLVVSSVCMFVTYVVPDISIYAVEEGCVRCLHRIVLFPNQIYTDHFACHKHCGCTIVYIIRLTYYYYRRRQM